VTLTEEAPAGGVEVELWLSDVRSLRHGAGGRNIGNGCGDDARRVSDDHSARRQSCGIVHAGCSVGVGADLVTGTMTLAEAAGSGGVTNFDVDTEALTQSVD
jgi:hypothetical protein